MKKIFAILLLMLVCAVPVYGVQLKGGVTYTVEDARRAAFEGIAKKIDMTPFKDVMKDPFYRENMQAIRDGKRYVYDVSPRAIQIGYVDGKKRGYSIQYFPDYHPYAPIAYTYSFKGNLDAINIFGQGDYPKRNLTYDKDGNLYGIIFVVAKGEKFIFDENGKFEEHDINGVSYDENGKRLHEVKIK